MSNRYFINTRILFVIVSLCSTLSFASATGSVTIERGTPATVAWIVVGGGDTCTGSWDIGSDATVGAATYYTWDGSTRSSAGTTTFQTASSNAFVIAGFFRLRCTSGGNSDTVDVTVEDCGGALSPGRTFWDGSACVVPVVSGSCAANAYNCTTGSSGSNASISNGYTWMCNGSGGGGNDSCHECTGGTSWDGDSCELTPVNGVCAGTHYSCTTGTYAGDGALSSGTYSWTCNGSNGGSNSGTCTESCSASAAVINNISWSPASIAYNDSSTVSWSTTNAASCTIRSSLTGTEVSTSLNNVGSLYANRTANDTWSISCKNSCDVRSATSSATLTVASADSAPTGTATAVQCGLASGNASDSDSASTQLTIGIAIDGGAEQTTTTSGGGHTFSYQTSSVSAGSHSYVIRARGVDSGGSENGNNPVIGSGSFTCTTPTVSLTANGVSAPTITLPTDTVTLAWSTTNLNVTGSTCTASNDGGLAWTGGKATTSGSESSPSMSFGTYIYTLSCAKPGLTGTYSDSATVTVDSTLVNPTITASSPTIQSGGSSNLVFGNTAGAVQCDFYKDGIFDKTQPGSGGAIGATINTGALTSGVYTYMYTCKNAYDQWGSSPTATVTVVTDAVCGATHYSCTSGVSANNQVSSPGWTWDCNSADGGANVSCSETGYSVTTSINYRPGATGSITPGPGVTWVASGGSQTVTITPTGSSMIYARQIDGGAIERVSGVAPVSPAPIDFTNITSNHTASTTLYVPTPVTVTVTETSGIADTKHLGDNITIHWTTDGNTCAIYDFAGTALIKNVGAVNPADASTTLIANPIDLPSTVGKFGYVVRCTDSTDINRGSGEDSATIVLSCPRDPVSYRYSTYPVAPVTDPEFTQCTNAVPTISLNIGNQNVVLGQSVVYTSTANDATADIVAHQFEWMNPNGTYSWQASPQGTVSYDVPSTFQATPQSSHVIQATFTPTSEGTYFVRSVAQDDNLNSSLNGYFTPPSGRLTYTDTNFLLAPRVTVTRRAGAQITPVDESTFRWYCYNTDFMSLQRFDGVSTTTVIGYRSIPPTAGTFNATGGTVYYSLLCESSQDSAVAVYFPPTLTQNAVTDTTVDLAWNCNTASAQSIVIERDDGSLPISSSDTSTSTFVQNDLTAQTDYTYTLRCYSGPLVSGSVTGTQIGLARLAVQTAATIIDPNPIVIDANIRGKASDPSTLLSATTTDGTFYDWTYTITSGTPTSCEMAQRNDNGSWYSNIPPDTDPSNYTLAWSSMLTSDKQAFVNSFTTKHDWKITCVSPLGQITSVTWSLVKVRPSIPIIDSITQPASGPTLADVTLHCSILATNYKIRDSLGTIVQTGVGTTGISSIAWSPTDAGNYSLTCDDGPVVVVAITANMWDPTFEIKGSTKSLGNTSSVTLTWKTTNQINPSDLATCRIWAEVTIPATCDATCLAARDAASTTLNNAIQTGFTDVNDPYWPNGAGTRTIVRALTTPADFAITRSTTTAGGKATITGIRYGTTFIGQCDNTPPVKYKVGITRVNEG